MANIKTRDRVVVRGRELAKLLKQVKGREILSYRTLSVSLDTNWTLISAWLKGRVIPSFPSQEKIDHYLRELGYGNKIDVIDVKLGFLKNEKHKSPAEKGRGKTKRRSNSQ